MRKAGAKSAAGPRRSSLDNPKPVTPWPVYCAASLASVLASIGCLVRLAAMTIPTPMSAARAALAAASSSSSVKTVMPPYMEANPDGSACSSSQPDPSARSSSAISLTSLHRSSGVRSTDRAVS